MSADRFTPADDGLHEPSDSFYETETYWFSFFIPERALGAWFYNSVRANPGVTAGGMWIWDATSALPWELPFYENFSHLKLPVRPSPDRLEFPTGLRIDVREPGMVYDLTYRDRNRAEADLRFEGLEEPVPLRHGTPPFPKASHYDQAGHVTGQVRLDGETLDVDCFAVRDRSWGPRPERGFRRVGYTWAASEQLTVLTYTSLGDRKPDEAEEIHSGYVRRDGLLSRIVGGRRSVRRDPAHGWLTGIDFEVRDEQGRTTTGTAEAISRMILPSATSICLNSSLRWVIDGEPADGEDQDVWPIHEWRQRARV